MEGKPVIITKAIAIKEECADDGLHQVIGECHLSYIRKRFHQPGHQAAAEYEHDECSMANSKG